MGTPLSDNDLNVTDRDVNPKLTIMMASCGRTGRGMMYGEGNGPSMRTALAIGLALGLAACDLTQPPPPASSPPEPLVTPAAVTRLPPPPPRKPSPPSVAKLPPAPEIEAEPQAEPQPQTPAPAATTGSFDQLLGLDQPQVAALLGAPGTRADAPPATIWRYGDATCDVDIYFYLDLQSERMRALHYEVRNHDLSERSDQRCYDALANERRARADSATDPDRPR
jgi:hypothetical protein